MLTLFLLDNSKALKAKKWLKIRGCNVAAMLSNVIAMLSNVCYILSMIKKGRSECNGRESKKGFGFTL